MSTRIGRRIAVYGQTGSGKSTLARQLGDRLGLPVIEPDALFHRANWEPTPEDEFRPTGPAAPDQRADRRVSAGYHGRVLAFVRPRAQPVAPSRVPVVVSFRPPRSAPTTARRRSAGP